LNLRLAAHEWQVRLPEARRFQAKTYLFFFAGTVEKPLLLFCFDSATVSYSLVGGKTVYNREASVINIYIYIYYSQLRICRTSAPPEKLSMRPEKPIHKHQIRSNKQGDYPNEAIERKKGVAGVTSSANLPIFIPRKNSPHKPHPGRGLTRVQWFRSLYAAYKVGRR
jgi:hypothetical protein